MLLSAVAAAPSPSSIGFVLAALVLAFLLWHRLSRPLATMRGPRGYPLIGIGLTLPPRATEVFRQWALEYGEVFKMRVGWYNWVVINSPEAFKEILDRQSHSTSSKIPAPIGHDVATGNMRLFTMPYGPKWRSHRTIMHQLLSPKMTLTFVPTQEFEAKQFLYQLAFDNADQAKWAQHVRRLSFSIVMTSTYGRRIDSGDHEDLRIAAETSKSMAKISRPGAFIEDDFPFLAKLPHWLQPSRRAAKEHYKIIRRGKMRAWERLRAELEAGKAPPSFGRSLMESDYKSQGLTDEDAAWIVAGLVEAGAEITAVVIQTLILFLAAAPEAQERANEELTRVVGSERLPRFEDLPDLPYVRACVKETMRRAPVTTLSMKHFTDHEVVYKEHRIPKGTVVFANTSFLHHDPSRYEEPFAFKPERYLNHNRSSAEYAVAADPYQRDHFTFGAGRRICPATRLAENTLNIAAAHLLWAFEIRPPLEVDSEGKQVEGQVDTSEDAFEPAGGFQAPKPFRVRFVGRSPERIQLVKEQWELAEKVGYQLRGLTVDAEGVAAS
ncbi:hypothetical protein VTN96DRAFT_3975 [Rasamsonia emersonii]